MVFDELRLDGKVAIVTGAGRGLGKAMALALAEAGADVIISSRKLGNLEKTAAEIAKMGPYQLLSDGSQLPVFFFRLVPGVTNYTVYDVSAKMRERGWQVPAYSLPEPLTSLSGLRVVVRNGFGRDLADLFLEDLRSATRFLESLRVKLPLDPSHTDSFRH